MHTNILLPKAPTIIDENGNTATFEVENLYPGYGHTLGNSLRRIILSSMEGVTITGVKIEGVQHEFSTIPGVVEDVITLILNLKKINFRMPDSIIETINLDVKGEGKIYAKDIKCPTQVEVVNGEEYICEISSKNTNLKIEITVEKGVGYLSKENRKKKEKTPVGTIELDADFSPVRKVKYEVENMRVLDRTDYNRMFITIETDGTVSSRDVFFTAVKTMIAQLESISTLREKSSENEFTAIVVDSTVKTEDVEDAGGDERLKTKVDNLPLSVRTSNALLMAGIKTVAGLVRRTEEDVLNLDGIGAKGVDEIKSALTNLSLTLREDK
jgi:DNA-directed RNA polymerase subunit alpha